MINLDPIRRQIADVSRRRMVSAADRMTSDLKRTAPVDTGDLRTATTVKVTSTTPTSITAEALIDVDYGVFVVQGTRPHIITPKRAQALRFYWPKMGGVVYFKSVQHPGTAANGFFTRVVQRFASYLS